MPTPTELLAAVRKLELSSEDAQEIEKRLSKPTPTAADYAFVKAIIRTRTLEDLPTIIPETEIQAYLKAEEAAATMAIASLKAITEDIDTLETTLKHG